MGMAARQELIAGLPPGTRTSVTIVIPHKEPPVALPEFICLFAVVSVERVTRRGETVLSSKLTTAKGGQLP
jgi:hypothetical protein